MWMDTIRGRKDVIATIFRNSGNSSKSLQESGSRNLNVSISRVAMKAINAGGYDSTI